MCRLLGYLGAPIALEQLVTKPDHSLLVQSYAPKELEVALMNADGYGLGWYDLRKVQPPFAYRSILPMWNDGNLAALSRYIEAGCFIAYARSATPGQGVDAINCQPFQSGNWLFCHNGYIQRFRNTLHRPMGAAMGDRAYRQVRGSTDSEHIWGLILDALYQQPQPSLSAAVAIAFTKLAALAREYDTPVAANVVISDGQQLVATRWASHGQAPSLYWLRHADYFGGASLVASEPLFDAPWQPCPEATLFTLLPHRDPEFRSLPTGPQSPLVPSQP
jgi:ergothioneine biosynthesis protein EgtC